MTDKPLSGITCEIVRNKRTGHAFVVLDDSHNDRYKLVTPEGEIKTLPSSVFDDELVSIDTSLLPDPQRAALDEHEAIVGAGEIRDAQLRQKEMAASVRHSDSSSPRPPPKRREVKPMQGPRGVAATWNCDKLTFYRHKIVPLKPTQSFRIEFYDGRILELKKSEFESAFNDVVMSPKYRSEGFYTYDTFPEKAQKYLKS